MSRFGILPALTVTSLVVVMSCSPVDMTPVEPTTATALQPISDPAEALARTLALGMRSADARTSVRDAMRRSRLTEHKLVLQDFVRSPDGEVLLERAAEASGMTQAQLMEQIDSLPRLDFYVPSSSERRSWRATDNIVVGINLGTDWSTTSAYTIQGVRRVLRNDAAGIRPFVSLLLHPEEFKATRIDAQPDVPGAVIEDPGDGELSVVSTWVDANGTAHRKDWGAGQTSVPSGDGPTVSFIRSCEEDPSQSFCQPPPPPRDTSFLYRFRTSSVCDNYDCNQGNEFKISGGVYNNSGTLLAGGTLEFGGWPPTRSLIVMWPLVYGEPGEPQAVSDYLKVVVKEIDEWPNADDYFRPDAFAQLQHNVRLYGESSNSFLHEDDHCCVWTNYAW